MMIATFSVVGTPAASHTHTITITHPSIGSRSANYITVGADTLNSIATACAAAINGESVLGAKGVAATANGAVVTIKFPFLGASDPRPTITTSTVYLSVSLTTPTITVVN